MQTSIELLTLIKRRLKLTLSAAEMDQALAGAFIQAIKNESYKQALTKKVAQIGKLHHLRTKETPEDFLKYNFQEIAPGIIENFIDTTLAELLQKQQLNLISEITLESAVQNDKGEIQLQFLFFVAPNPNDINIDIPSIKLETISISDSEISNSIEQLRYFHVQWSPIDSKAEAGNKVLIDLRGEMQGKALPDAHADNMEIALDIDVMMPGFQEQLFGLQAGDVKVFDLSYPTDYPDTNLAGKLATFTVTVKNVFNPVLPLVDKHLVKACGVESGELIDLIRKIQQNLFQHKTVIAKQQLKEKVFNLLLEKNIFEVPPKMLEDEQKHIAGDPDHRVDPEYTVRLSLIVSALIKKFNLTPDPVQVEQQIEEFVSVYKDKQKIKQAIYANPKELANMQMLALEAQLIEKLTE